MRNYKKCTFFLATNFCNSFSPPLHVFCITWKEEKYWVASQSPVVQDTSRKEAHDHSQSYPHTAVRWMWTVGKTGTRSCALTTALFFALPALPVNTPWWKQKCSQWLPLYPFKLSLLTGTSLWTLDTPISCLLLFYKVVHKCLKSGVPQTTASVEIVNHTDFSTVMEFVFQGTVQNYYIIFASALYMFGCIFPISSNTGSNIFFMFCTVCAYHKIRAILAVQEHYEQHF